jgi:hypothetical protein
VRRQIPDGTYCWHRDPKSMEMGCTNPDSRSCRSSKLGAMRGGEPQLTRASACQAILTAVNAMVSLPKMSMTFTATMY